MNIALLAISLLLMRVGAVVPQVPAASSGTASVDPTLQASPTLRDYQDILERERKLLDEQSERYYSRIDKLIDRTLWALGLIGLLAITAVGGLMKWVFGTTRKELEAFIRDKFQQEVSSLIDVEMSALRGTIQDLRDQVDRLRTSQTESIVWVFPGTAITAEQEIQALIAAGVSNVKTTTPETADQLELGEPDLVILSYDGSDEAERRLAKIVEILRKSSPVIPLIIYTYNPSGDEVRLGDEERQLLKGFDWYLPANFPTTLLAQTQLLARTRGGG